MLDAIPRDYSHPEWTSAILPRFMGKHRYPAGYGPVEPIADYRPWELDSAFSEVADAVAGHTKVDRMRLWELWTLTHNLRGVPGDILEVGVWRGGSAAVLGRAAVSERRLILADTFRGVVKAGPKDKYYTGGEHADTDEQTVRHLLESMGLGSAVILPGIFPDETADSVSDSLLALVHIDVDVYQSGRDVFEWAWPRLSEGGVVVFDDYGFYGCEGITALVNELFADPPGRVIHNLNGHALVIKV